MTTTLGRDSVILDRLIDGGAVVHEEHASWPVYMMREAALWWARHSPSPKLRRRFILSVRVAWAMTICLLISYYWQWSEFAIYISPVVCIMSTTMYLGLWQVVIYNASISVFLGICLGVIISFARDYRPLQVVLTFLVITYLNRYPGWDRVSIVMGSLNVLLGVIFPYLSHGIVVDMLLFKTGLSLILVPFLMNGFSLLVPFPALAIYSAKSQALVVCRKLSWMTHTVIQSFLSHDEVDLHCAEFDQYLAEIHVDLVELRALARYSDAERTIFFSAKDLSASLIKFADIATLLVAELSSIRDLLKHITFNSTQMQFSEQLHDTLEEIKREVDLLLTIAGEFFLQFDVSLWGSLCQWVQWCRGTHSESESVRERQRVKTSADERESDSEREKHRERDAPRFAYEEHPQYCRHAHSFSHSHTVHTAPSHRDSFHSSESHDFVHYSYNERDLEAAAHSLSLSDEERERQTHKETHEEKLFFFEKALNRARHVMRSDMDASTERVFKLRGDLLFQYNEVRKDFVFWDPRSTLPGLGEREKEREREKTKATERERGREETEVTRKAALLSAEIDVLEMRRSLQTLHQQSDGRPSSEAPGHDELHAADTASLIVAPRTLTEAALKEISRHTTRSHNDASAATATAAAVAVNAQDERQSQILLHLAVREDNIRMGLKNLGPRAAYVQRVSMLIESLAQLRTVFAQRGTFYSAWNIPYDLVRDFGLYVWSVCVFWYVHTLYYRDLLVNIHDKDHLRAFHHDLRLWLTRHIQAIKIALTVSILTALLLYGKLSMLYNGGQWAVLVPILIRQENTSSSFLVAYQRLEGTAIGAIYAFFIYQLFSCHSQTCGKEVIVPAMVVWVLLCSPFREGPQHGYAAMVASFTPLVLLVGTDHSMDAAWGRIEQTVLGVVMYLAVDNLIMPRRTYPSISTSVLMCISQAKSVIAESVGAVEVLMSAEACVADASLHVTQDEHGEVHVACQGDDQTHISGTQQPQEQQEHAAEHGESVPRIEEQKVVEDAEMARLSLRPPNETSFLTERIPSAPHTPHATALEIELASLSVRSQASPSPSPSPAVTPSQGLRKRAASVRSASTQASHVQRTTTRSRRDSVLSLEREESTLHLGNVALIEELEEDDENFPQFVSTAPTGDIEKELIVASHHNSVFVHYSDQRNQEFLTLFRACKAHLDKSEAQLKAMNAQIALQKSLLAMVGYEPELWHAPFPVTAYTRLQASFAKLYQSGFALNAGSRVLSVVLCQMLKSADDVGSHLNHFRFMTHHLLQISGQAQAALTFTLEAFSKLYSDQDFEMDLKSLLSLRTSCESLLETVSDHFRAEYVHHAAPILLDFNPYFVVAWQNVFVSASDLVRDLSELGMSLHVVRNLEMLVHRK